MATPKTIWKVNYDQRFRGSRGPLNYDDTFVGPRDLNKALGRFVRSHLKMQLTDPIRPCTGIEILSAVKVGEVTA